MDAQNVLIPRRSSVGTKTASNSTKRIRLVNKLVFVNRKFKLHLPLNYVSLYFRKNRKKTIALTTLKSLCHLKYCIQVIPFLGTAQSFEYQGGKNL